jgi:hypothetical protein
LPPAATDQPAQEQQAQPPAADGSKPAQQQPAEQSTPALQPREGPPTATLQLFSREVDLIFTVTDRKGQFVTGLNQQDFGLLDDGRTPQRVVSFKQQTNLPLRVGVMLDTSIRCTRRAATRC